MKSLFLYPTIALGAYKKFDRAGATWAQAQQRCNDLGANLVTFESESEFELFSSWLGETTEAYWIGYRDDHGDVVTYDNTPAGFTTFSEGEPNNKMGPENCIRLRFGAMNDALCEIYWAGPKKQNIGMGYICEGDFAFTPAAPSAEDSNIRDLQPAFTEYISITISLPMSQRNRMKTVNGLYQATEETAAGRPVYVNTNYPKTFLSFYLDETHMTESDGMWKFSTHKQINLLGGHVFMKSTATDPIYEKQNCLKDPLISAVDNPNDAFSVSINLSSGKARLVTGIYQPTNDVVGLTSNKPIYKKLDNSVYAVHADGFWNFHTPRTLSTYKPLIKVESDAELGDLSEAEDTCWFTKSKTCPFEVKSLISDL